MTSNIVSDTIDENYPVAGQDNDSQGFRDNFAVIKDGLATANSEITDLQVNTAKTDRDNNFNGSLIDNAQTNRLYGTVYNTNTELSGTVTIDYAAGEYQIVTVSRNCTLRFQNWPTRTDNVPVYAKVRVALIPNSSTSYNVTFSTVNGSVRTTALNATFPITDNPEIATVAEVWTASDGTGDIYVNILGNFNNSFDLADLGDVNIVDPVDNDYLKYIDGVWTNDAQGPSTSIESLTGNVGNVSLTTPDPSHGDILVYDGDTERWTNQPVTDQLNKLADVSVASAQLGNVIRYTGIADVPTSWRSEKDPNLVFLNLKISDVGVGNDSFLINDVSITNPVLNKTLILNVGNIYRFDVSDESNRDGGGDPRGELVFTTLPPSTLPVPPSSVTDPITVYLDNVVRSGTPGTPGAYVEILITKDTPSPLYIYGVGSITLDNLGRDIPITVNTTPYYSGSEELVSGATANNVKSVSYFITSAASTGALAAGYEGQIKTFAMRDFGGNMVITVTNPGWKTTGTGTITFSALGQACTLQYIADKWICVSNNGGVFA